MMDRFLLWLRSLRHADDEPTTGAQAVVEARERLAAEEERAAKVQELAIRARKSRNKNCYAAALRASMKGRH